MSDTFPVEIFSCGEFSDVLGRPVRFDESDLETVVANFSKLRDVVKPPITLGHVAPGSPAYGWVTGLEKVGMKLVAHVAQVPQLLRDAIAAGRYKRVSSEFHLAYQNSQYEKNHPTGVTGKVLEAVAFLGSELPQVGDLADIGAYMAREKTGDRVIASYAKRHGPGDNLFQNPDGTQFQKGDAGAIQPGSNFHPVQKQFGEWVVRSRHGVILSRHPTQAAAMAAFKLLNQNGAAHFTRYAEAVNKALKRKQPVKENRINIGSVLTEDEAAYLSQNLGDRASQNIIARAGERVAQKLWAAQDARNGERVRLAQQQARQARDQEADESTMRLAQIMHAEKCPGVPGADASEDWKRRYKMSMERYSALHDSRRDVNDETDESPEAKLMATFREIEKDKLTS